MGNEPEEDFISQINEFDFVPHYQRVTVSGEDTSGVRFYIFSCFLFYCVLIMSSVLSWLKCNIFSPFKQNKVIVRSHLIIAVQISEPKHIF